MYKTTHKSQLCAKNSQDFKVQLFDLAKSDVCVTVNVCTVYDKNQITQNMLVFTQGLLYDTQFMF